MARRSVPPRQYFRRFVNSHIAAAPADFEELPLIHGTKSILLRDILASGEISLPDRECPILGKRLVFTFYGRPSYRANSDGGGLKRTAGAPTYLLLQPRAFDSAVIAHPLDTGAFSLDLYRQHVDAALRPADFGFEPTIESVQKVVSFFFGDNNAYLDNRPRKVNIPEGHDEAQAYYDVINDSDETKSDERQSSIEIALERPIPIKPEWVRCIIVPDLLYDSRDYGEAIRALGIEVRTYRFIRGLKPNDYVARVFDAVNAYYNEKK